MKHLLSVIFFLLLPLLISHPASGSDRSIVYIIPIEKEINSTTWIYLQKGLQEARQLHAGAVLINMNTYGGELVSADSMRTAILYSPIPVYVFVDNNAASAGALISIASRKIFMRRGASIGAATVVNGVDGKAMPDKYQSYMRSMMRATAEAHGRDTVVSKGDTLIRWHRDPLIAEAMVDDRVVVPSLIDSGKVLTFTAEEAVKWHYCDGIAESTDEVITRYLGMKNYEIQRYEPSTFDNLKGFLMNSVVQSLLIIIILGGIYFEMQTPGIGFPSLAAIVAAVLYFMPLWMDGLAANWEILIFLLGIVLIIMEVFVIPGFGVAGVSGIVLTIGGLVMALLDNPGFDFRHVPSKDIGRASLTVLLGLGIGFALIIWVSSRIGNRGIFRRVALETDLDQSVSSPVLSSLVGKRGLAETVLRPSGKVRIDGQIYDSISESGFIERGTPVEVIHYENAQVYVIAVKESKA